MLKVILLVLAVTTFAQIVPSCDRSTEVVGWVEDKRVDRAAGVYTITINRIEYDVPGYFWTDVRVGDLVKWDGRAWTIVKRAS